MSTDETTNNLILFPKKSVVTPQPTGLVFPDGNPIPKDTLTLEQRERATKDFIEGISLDMMGYLFLHMTLSGTNKTAETDCKDVMLIIEGLRSLMMKNMGIEHPLQKFAKELFDEPSPATKAIIMEMAKRQEINRDEVISDYDDLEEPEKE